jgi:hypothetical protein
MDCFAEWWQLKIFVFWDITHCRLLNVYRRFEGSNYFNLQDQTVEEDHLFHLCTRPSLEERIKNVSSFILFILLKLKPCNINTPASQMQYHNICMQNCKIV